MNFYSPFIISKLLLSNKSYSLLNRQKIVTLFFTLFWYHSSKIRTSPIYAHFAEKRNKFRETFRIRPFQPIKSRFDLTENLVTMQFFFFRKILQEFSRPTRKMNNFMEFEFKSLVSGIAKNFQSLRKYS